MTANTFDNPHAKGEPSTKPSSPPALCSRPMSNERASAATTTSMIEQTDHNSIAQPLTTRGLSEFLPLLRIRRMATITSSTGNTTLITPSTPAENACSTRPMIPFTRNHSEAQKNTASTISRKHRPSRRYTGSNSPTPATDRTSEPKPRGTARMIRFHSGSSTGVRASSPMPPRPPEALFPVSPPRDEARCVRVPRGESLEGPLPDEDVVRAIASSDSTHHPLFSRSIRVKTRARGIGACTI